jgi:hypothetical protein
VLAALHDDSSPVETVDSIVEWFQASGRVELVVCDSRWLIASGSHGTRQFRANSQRVDVARYYCPAVAAGGAADVKVIGVNAGEH